LLSRFGKYKPKKNNAIEANATRLYDILFKYKASWALDNILLNSVSETTIEQKVIRIASVWFILDDLLAEKTQKAIHNPIIDNMTGDI